MLLELKNARQISGENKRRWFTSVDMDLITWVDIENKPINFELCYDKGLNEKSLRWSPSGFVHSAVDDGENNPGKYKSTPILRETSHFEAGRVHGLFLAESAQLPDEIKNFVIAILENLTLSYTL